MTSKHNIYIYIYILGNKNQNNIEPTIHSSLSLLVEAALFPSELEAFSEKLKKEDMAKVNYLQKEV